MNLTVSDILEFLKKVAPSSLAEKNDPIGLQVGSKKALVKGILLTVDPKPLSLQVRCRLGFKPHRFSSSAFLYSGAKLNL